MVLSSSLRFLLYPPPASLFVNAMSVFGTAILMSVGFMEIKGKHLQYSKFWKVGGEKSESKAEISSKKGMLLLYTPALVAGMASFGLFPSQGLRFSLLAASLSLHFLKRVIEVLLIHKYSGSMGIRSTIIIATSYFSGTVTMIYAQYLTKTFSEPSINLMYPGIAIFLIGIGGNFYHHCLLANLRSKGEKVYKIPRGGLFNLVICPHYLFEILGFIGISCISQTIYAFCFTWGTIIYLLGRSYATRNWYISKFEDFSKDVKAVIPYVF